MTPEEINPETLPAEAWRPLGVEVTLPESLAGMLEQLAAHGGPLAAQAAVAEALTLWVWLRKSEPSQSHYRVLDVDGRVVLQSIDPVEARKSGRRLPRPRFQVRDIRTVRVEGDWRPWDPQRGPH